jgi:hypothetical protein
MIVVLTVLLIGAFAALIVLGTTTREERSAKFMTTCGDADFSAKQCEFLFALSEKTTDNTATLAATAR